MLAFLAFAALAYVLVALFALPSTAHTWRLGLQLILVGVPLGLLLHAGRRPATESRLPAVSISAIVVLFLLVALPLAYRWNGGQRLPDEGAYRFHARIFSAGLLTAPSPRDVLPDDAAAKTATGYSLHYHVNGRWFTRYPPGWPALIAAATFLKSDWLLNVAFGCLVLWLTSRIGALLFEPAVGWIAVAIAAASPYFFANCLGWFSHPSCAAFVAAATYFCWRGIRLERQGDFLAMSACLGAAVLIRPYTGFIISMTIAALLVSRLRERPRVLARALFTGALVATVPIAVTLLYNHALTGDMLRFPYALQGESYVPPELNATWATLQQSLLHHARWSLVETILATSPFLLPLALLAWRNVATRVEVASMTLLALSLVAAHLLMTMTSASTWGERFYFETFFAYCIVCAKGAIDLARRVDLRTLGYIAAVFLALQLFHFAADVVPVFRRAHPYNAVRAAAESLPPGPHAVFLQDGPGFVAKHWNLNSASWQTADHVFLVDPGLDHRARIACALHRPRWLLLQYEADSGRVIIEDSGLQPLACPGSR